jgi:hypothetical protein
MHTHNLSIWKAVEEKPKASLGSTARPCLKKRKKNSNKAAILAILAHRL